MQHDLPRPCAHADPAHQQTVAVFNRASECPRVMAPAISLPGRKNFAVCRSAPQTSATPRAPKTGTAPTTGAKRKITTAIAFGETCARTFGIGDGIGFGQNPAKIKTKKVITNVAKATPDLPKSRVNSCCQRGGQNIDKIIAQRTEPISLRRLR